MEQDSTFYREFRSGLIVSGGEWQVQSDFSAALPATAHERGRIRQRDHPTLDLD
jgi:pyruvate-formate lyase-activating enzyme